MFVDAEEDEIIAGAEEAMLCGEESKILAAFSWLIHNKRIPPMTLLGMARNEAYRRRPWSAYVKCSNLCLVFIMSMIPHRFLSNSHLEDVMFCDVWIYRSSAWGLRLCGQLVTAMQTLQEA